MQPLAHPIAPLTAPPTRAAQRGSAILSAMLTVTLVATLAASALWQQWRSSEVEAAQRARLQAHWLMTGAVDWARLILREDARQGNVDYLSEPWAIPLEEARLSTFLASGADGAVNTDAAAAETADIPDVFMSGRIQDLQARLNISNLVQAGTVDPAAYAAFLRLFQLLNLPAQELEALITYMQSAQRVPVQNGTSSTDTAAGASALMPQQLAQLGWSGLSAPTLLRLQPYICLLPVATPVNLNTASAEVLYAVVPGFELPDAQQFVRQRDQQHFDTLAEAQKRANLPAVLFKDGQHAVSTRFFEVHSSLRSGQSSTHEIATLQRDGLEVKILSRRPAPQPGV